MVENREREGGRAGPSFWRGGLSVLGLGWERQEGLKEAGPGHQDCGWEPICHRNNLGEIGSGSGIGIWEGKKKKGPGHSSKAQKCG